MKKFLPLLALLVSVGFVGSSLRAPKNPAAFDVVGFSKLPVLLNGRLKPLDTVARTSLLQFQGRQRVTTRTDDPSTWDLIVERMTGKKHPELTPTEWLLDVIFRPDLADTYKTFEIVHPDLLALFDLKMEDGDGKKRFSLKQLQPKIAELQRQVELARPVEAAVRTPFQKAVVQLYGNLVEYQRLRHAFVSPTRPDFLSDLLKFQDNLQAGIAAVRAKIANQPHDEALAKQVAELASEFDIMNGSTSLLVVPPPQSETDLTQWKTAGAALLDTFRTGQVNASALAYAGFAHAWRNNQPDQFNKLLELFRAELVKRFGPALEKNSAETRFNAAQPFYTSTWLYGLAFFAAIFSWLFWPRELGRAAFWITTVAWIVSTAGIATRMWLEGRPPVTNLYSSALFVGWGAVALCLVLEYFFRNAIATAAAGAVGVSTLIIAHHLSLSGDTLEMMRAVLDSNFWLATHVIVITAGYSATFLAGFLAIIYIVRGVFTASLDKATADSIARMVYGIICFATLFSFVGTILGGIWADQSWGRFWGWDPKENGALLIVIWNAIILHARWGGMIRQRGLMNLAIGGNIVTAWSWFGTNMLGVGLHSYGFTDAAFMALTGFAVSQIVLIGIGGLVPMEKWRSFKNTRTLSSAPEHEEELASAK